MAGRAGPPAPRGPFSGMLGPARSGPSRLLVGGDDTAGGWSAADPGDGAELLDAEECWSLLAQVPRGRLAAGAEETAAVLPVRHTVDGERLLVRCGDETFLRACDGVAVAFTAGPAGPAGQGGSAAPGPPPPRPGGGGGAWPAAGHGGGHTGGGWSVRAVGRGRLVTAAGGGVLLSLAPDLLDGHRLDG